MLNLALIPVDLLCFHFRLKSDTVEKCGKGEPFKKRKEFKTMKKFLKVA